MKKAIIAIMDFITENIVQLVIGTVCFFVVQFPELLAGVPVIMATLNATIATLIAITVSELKDLQYGQKFKWVDIWAGITFPAMYWLIYGLTELMAAI